MAEFFLARETLCQSVACHWTKVDVDPGFPIKQIQMPPLRSGKSFRAPDIVYPGDGYHWFRSVGDRAIFNRKIWIQNQIVHKHNINASFALWKKFSGARHSHPETAMFDTVTIGFKIFAFGTFSIPRFCSEMNCPIISSNSHVCQLTPLPSFSRLRWAKHVFCKKR